MERKRGAVTPVRITLFCLAFAIEAHTGTVVDVTVVERGVDLECSKNNQVCPNKLHGSTKSLEVAAVLHL